LRDAGESRRCAAAQRAQQDRLDLIVLVVPRHEVLRAATALHFAQPRVPRAACFRLRRVGTQLQLRQFKRQTVTHRQVSYHLSNVRTFHLHPMIRVRSDELQVEASGGTEQ